MMTFEQCVREHREDAHFVSLVNQLVGLQLGAPRGLTSDEDKFRRFVFDTVWSTMPEHFKEMGSAAHLKSIEVH